MLVEGGHAVTNVTKIHQANVKPTLEEINNTLFQDLNVNIPKSARLLGSTGKKGPDGESGDIDIAIDVDTIVKENNLSVDEIGDFITKACEEYSEDVVNNTGTGIVSCSWKIENEDGKQNDEFVQLDLMLVKQDVLDFTEFAFWSPQEGDSEYKGAHRNILLMAIAEMINFKVIEKAMDAEGVEVPAIWERLFLDLRKGLMQGKQTRVSPKSGKLVKGKKTFDKKLLSANKEEIIDMLLGPDGTEKDVNSFETIVKYMNSDSFPYQDKKKEIFKKAAQEIKKQFGELPPQIKSMVQEDTMLKESKLDISKGIRHLEHLEDLILSSGKEGGAFGVETVRKFTDSVKDQNEDVVVSEKIDGAPSLFFGKDPAGKFFVATKSIFGKKQRVAYSLADIQRQWSGGIVQVLSFAFKTLKPAYKTRNTAGQGDILFVSKAAKNITEHEGQKFITFQPNTIMYAIPVDPKSDLFRNVRAANLGIVVHGAYETRFGEGQRVDINRLPEKAVTAIAEEIDRDKRVFAIDPFVKDISPIRGSEDELEELSELSKSVEGMLDEVDEEFNDAWVESKDPMIKKAKLLLPQFINQQARASGDAETILTAKDEKDFLRVFKKKLNEFLSARSRVEQEKLKTSAGKERKAQSFDDFKKWMIDMGETFEPMLRAYFRLFSIKNLMIKLFDSVEKKLGQTFVVDRKNDYALYAVKPEGYVLLNAPNMVKIVDRAEFSRNNILYSPFTEGGTFELKLDSTGDPESIGDKKRIYPEKLPSIADAVAEEILDSIDGAGKLNDGFNDEKIVETADKFKKYNAVYVGRLQPPTIAHANNIANLSKLFKNVYVLLSDAKNKTEKYLKKNPLDVRDRKELLESDPKIRTLKNVKIEGGSTNAAYGITTESKEKELRDLFEIPEDETIVLTIGKEEDRFFQLRDRGALFVLNTDGEPSEEKPHGLFGIDLQKLPGKAGKVSASDVRQAIADDDLQTAKKMMAGTESTQNNIIDKIQSAKQDDTQREDMIAASEDYIRVEDFDIRKEVIDEIEEDFGIDQEEAMDMLLDILETRE